MVLIAGMIAGCTQSTETAGTDASAAEESVAAETQPSSASQKTINVSMGGIQSAEDAVTLAMNKMAETVAEKTNGEIVINVYPASQLGDATSQMESVSLGTQEMFVDSGSWVGTFVSDQLVETMFFAFRSEAHYRAYLESDIAANMAQKMLDQTGVRILANNWVRIPRSFASIRPIETPADMQGMKVRVPDIRGYLESVTAMGASPTQVAWGETYLALQQGTVDACEAPMDNMLTMSFYEATGNIAVTEHIHDNVNVYISDAFFQGLTPDQQQILTDAAKEAGDYYSEYVKSIVDGYVEEMVADGCNFTYPDVTAFQAACRQAAYDLEDEGLWEAGLYDQIQQISG
jgi:tripartite ATP-independent transporter DctP family solute receptor